MKTASRLYRALCSILYLAALVGTRSQIAGAQVSTSTVVGTIEDASGARLGDATVKLINVLTGTENVCRAGRYGSFFLPGVLPGTYVMQIERQDFASIRLSGLTLNVGDVKTFRIRMRVGSVDQTVTVDAGDLLVDTDDASISTVVGQRFVSDIPLDGRSFQDLISITPGAISQSPQAAAAGDFSVNGQRSDTNSYLVDGVSANIGPGPLNASRKRPSAGQFAATTSLGTTQGLVPLDALQEFRILGSTYSAEYGRTPGGQFSLLTRPGTEQMHGSAYSYLRNTYFDAGDWFEGFNHFPARGVYFYQQDIGGTFSGPLPIPSAAAHKALVFADYEDLHVLQPTAPLVQYTPNTGAPVADSIEPLIAAFPRSGLTFGSPPAMALFRRQTGLPSHTHSLSLRVDGSLTPGVSGFLRFGDTGSDSQTEQLSSVSGLGLGSTTYTAGLSAPVSARTTDELRLGWASSGSQLLTTIQKIAGSVPNDLAADLGAPASNAIANAQIYIRVPGLGESLIDTDDASNRLREWNLRDTVFRQAGSHLLHIGIDQRRFTSTVHPAPVSVHADFLDAGALTEGEASDLVVTSNRSASPVFNEFSAFVQDEWKATRRLTLSMGMRWEIDPAPSAAHGNAACTLRGDPLAPATLTLAPRGTPLWHTGLGVVAPRLGLAWAVNDTSGRELILRGGAGVFYDTANAAAAGAFNALGFFASSSSTNVALPAPAAAFAAPALNQAAYNHTLLYVFDPHQPLPFTAQWNVTMEQAIGKRQAVTVSYVAAEADRLLQEQQRNVTAGNPELGDIVYFPRGITSSYESLQAKFQRAVLPGLDVLASYLWARTIDFGSTNPAFPLTRGSSDLDIRHSLQGAFSWNPRKFEGGNTFLRNAMNGWGFDGRLAFRTAYPVTPLGNLSIDPITGDRVYGAADRLPGRPLYLYGPQYAGGRIINGGPSAATPAFVAPAENANGNAPRNIVRGFDAEQASFALRRDVRLYNRLTLQLRAEAFNVSNSPDFGYIDPHLANPLFGEPVLSLNQSFGQTGSLYQPGGPRSFQWMFKLAF